MRTFPSARRSLPQAAITKGSFTETQTISSTPFALMAAAASMKPGRCVAEQPGVNAPCEHARRRRVQQEARVKSDALRPAQQQRVPRKMREIGSFGAQLSVFSAEGRTGTPMSTTFFPAKRVEVFTAAKCFFKRRCGTSTKRKEQARFLTAHSKKGRGACRGTAAHRLRASPRTE